MNRSVARPRVGVAADGPDQRTNMAYFTPPGTARFWLFTLIKELAFIRLRQHESVQATDNLHKISQLDPTGGTGADVIEALIDGSKG